MSKFQHRHTTTVTIYSNPLVTNWIPALFYMDVLYINTKGSITSFTKAYWRSTSTQQFLSGLGTNLIFEPEKTRSKFSSSLIIPDVRKSQICRWYFSIGCKTLKTAVTDVLLHSHSKQRWTLLYIILLISLMVNMWTVKILQMWGEIQTSWVIWSFLFKDDYRRSV